MRLEDQVNLSFYKEIAEVDKRHGVVLVQHTDTGKIYVKKTLQHYDLAVFRTLQENRYAGIPVIKELMESDGSLILIEDYVSGHSLEELLETRLFSADETVKIISDLCDILSPIHSHDPSIIHRDIKASNVILDNEGKVYLIDFDASKIVSQGHNRDTDLIGTEGYAAPEQYGFGLSDQRTDIYALGVLMNKLLTGKFPSEEKYGGDLSRVIARATELDPENRYQNADRLKKALDVVSGIDVAVSQGDGSLHFRVKSSAGVKSFLSKLPYPVRELPGFRSGSPLLLVLAIVWYLLLLVFGLFGASKNPELTPVQNRYYDFATLILLLIPTLYLGNYLGVRDKLPWKKTSQRVTEVIRIVTGAAVSVLLVIIAVTIVAMVFHI